MRNEKKWWLGNWLTAAVVVVLLIEVRCFLEIQIKPPSLYLFINDTPKTVAARVTGGDDGIIRHFEIRSQGWQFVILPSNLKDGYLDESPENTNSGCMGRWPCGDEYQR
jgi:hypothetical protein